jgi:8-oxo-dGTP diphosphatase
VLVYLVRHAHAGSRAAWHDDDDLRPLSAKGARQAAGLIDRVDGAAKSSKSAVRRVVSSPARRCVETVEPIAEHFGCKVTTKKELAEGADPDDALALVLGMASSSPVVCSHGDLIPKMIRRLVAKGMKTKDANISQKGSLWVVEIEKGRPTKGRYYPPA